LPDLERRVFGRKAVSSLVALPPQSIKKRSSPPAAFLEGIIAVPAFFTRSLCPGSPLLTSLREPGTVAHPRKES
jgi:hypothetical protein